MSVKMQAKLGMADQSNFIRNYEKELGRLLGNDKNVINALTELANVNKPRANEIVGVIEKTIRKIPKERHLSHVYLIDSICKNHGQPYISYFGQNIVLTFCYIFKYADEEMRKSLYKLRQTWNDAEMFLDKLHELDTRVKNEIDPAWPIQKVKPRSSTNNKIIINPKVLPGGMSSIPQGTRKSADRDRQSEAEKETERIRMELLRKEKELLELKRKQVDAELNEQRNKERNKRAESAGATNSSSSGSKSTSSSTSTRRDNSSSNHKSERKSEPAAPTESQKESTETRDPRRRKKHSSDDKASSNSKSSSSHHSSSSSSSNKKSSSDKSSPKKSSKSDKDKDKKSSSSKSSSSKSSSKDKDRDKSSSSSSKRSSGGSSSQKDEDKKDGATAKKRERETSPKFSRTPSPVPQNNSQESSQDKKKSPVVNATDGGRISPLPQPPAKKIPKIPKKTDQDRRGEKRAQEADTWGDKENVGGDNKLEGVEFTPPPDKRPRPLMIDVTHQDMEGDGKHLSPVVAGWAKHKESNPDQFRTPIKENENFFGDQQYPMQQDEGFNNRGPHLNNHPNHRYHRDRWGGSRGGSYRRGERGGGGRGNGPMPPPAMRGGFHAPWSDNVRFGAPRGGRGGGFDHRGGGGRGGMGGPGGGNMRFDQEFSLPGLPGLDFTQADPEYIRNEVVPKLTNLAHECLKQGSINQVQFNEFVSKLEAMKGDQDGPGPRRPGPDGPHDNRGPNSDRPPGFGPQQKQHKNDLPLADQGELEKIKMDPTVSLEIDEVPRDIRWYGYTATITQDDNKLYEISFRKEMDTRCILIDDHIKVFCGVGAPNWTDFRVDNKVFKLRIGGPTREIFIDNVHNWHNLQFNSMKKIMFGGRMHKIYLPGDPPNVDIGKDRGDLCLGKVEVSIYNSQHGPEKKSKLFLDERAQLLIIDRKPHVCKFVENYSTLLINGHPFKTNFGGFPMVISVNGNKHFVKLNQPPEGVYISNITRPPPIRQNQGNKEGFVIPPAPVEQKLNLNTDIQDSETSHENEIPPLMASTPLPPQHSIEDPASTPKSTKVDEPPVKEVAEEPQPAAEKAAAPDIDDLWAKLQGSGIFSMFSNTTSGNTNGSAAGLIPGLDPELTNTIQPQQQPPAASSNLPIMSVPPPGFPTHQQQNELEQQKNRASRMRRHSVGIKDVVLKSHDPSLKERQQGIVDTLYGPNDLQCKSCGHRFTRDEMNNYSSHLDWHFRAKRRERDNARKAQSRRWYYEKADWIVSDEIEDEELDLSEEEVILEQSLEVPTVKVVAKEAGSNEHETCPVCMEQFNQVFKQGEEEEEGAWHLHNAMRDPNGVPYHPECFKDKELQDSKWEDDSIDTSNTDIKMEEGVEPPPTDTVNLDDDTEMTEVKKEPSPSDSDSKPAAAIENDLAKVKIESSENDAETVDVKTESSDIEAVKTEPTAEIKEEKVDANDSSVNETSDNISETKEEDTEEGNKTLNLESSDQQPAPVQMPKPKIDIKVSITTSMKQELTRQESQVSTTDEETEFDKDSIVVKSPGQEEIDAAKPKLKGKALNVVPMSCKDQGISGLCSIM